MIVENFKESIESYINELKKTPDDVTEYSYRTSFQNFVQGIIKDKEVTIIHEPKKASFGRPDFKVVKNNGVIGYIETKPLGSDIDKCMKTKQLRTYLSILPNLLVTNYKDFILLRDGEEVIRGDINTCNNMDSSSCLKSTENLARIMNIFLDNQVQKIKDPKELSRILANKTKLLRYFIKVYLLNNNSDFFSKKMYGLLNLFKNGLINDITQEEFIDIYSQALTYGLFMCRLNSTGDINKKTAFLNVPRYLTLIEEIFSILHLKDLPESIGWIVDEIINTLNNIDIKELKLNLSYKSNTNKEDPYIFFYEHFLNCYDKTKKKQKGVYYTPIPIVNFIIRSIKKILQNDFNKEGFEDHNTTVLDFACGTGTFLLEAFRNVIEGKNANLRVKYIREKLLRDFFGFEYLIAPYIICHLKLSQYLREQGFTFSENERIGVYLTDTLDETMYYTSDLFPCILEEGKKASEVKKKKPILIIMGNPPYNDHSRNKKKFIMDLIKDYKKGLDEKKTHLDDDYIKFIRYAQWKVGNEGQGIVGIITNNSYIDSIVQRVMRESLLETFDKIYILNLHGNKDRQEKDENVFDIKKVGIAIVFFIKIRDYDEENQKIVQYFSTLDHNLITREDKYQFLLSNDITTISWSKLNPIKPNYWFIDKYQDKSNSSEWSLTDIFEDYISGIIGSRDDFVMHINKDNLILVIKDLIDLNAEEIKAKYKLKDGRDWKVTKVKHEIVKDLKCLLKKEVSNSAKLTNDDWSMIERFRIRKIHYRILDFRYTYYFDKYGGFLLCPRYNIMENLVNKDNIALISVRQVAENKEFTHCFVTNEIPSSRMTISNRGGAYAFPLYTYQKIEKNLIYEEENIVKKLNMKKEFLEFAHKVYGNMLNGNDIMGYIYAILFSKTYRKKYYQYLRRDYPHIPFIKEKKLFYEVSKLGRDLIEIHTLNNNIHGSIKHDIYGDGDYRIDKYKYDKKKVYINSSQYFTNVEKQAWDLEIGGYKILEKYLASRKGMEMSLRDINHFVKIISIAEKSIDIMERIDDVIQKSDSQAYI